MNSLQDVIDEGFTVEDGIVQDFGKFENEPWPNCGSLGHVSWTVSGKWVRTKLASLSSWKMSRISVSRQRPRFMFAIFGFVSLIEGEIG